MMAESLPFCSAGPLSGLDLEAWYEDLQDILSSETKNPAALQLVSEQVAEVETLDNSPYLWSLESIDSTLPVNFTDEEVVALETVVDQLPSEVLGFLVQGSHNDFDDPSTSSESLHNQQDGAAEVDSGCSSSPSQTHTEDEDSSGSQCGTKRKRTSQPRGGKVRVKEKEQENEKKVSHLVSENERLKGEIERLTLEVERTRKSLIERMVNLKK
ncbi:DNA damage-inducible transcript 3 protein [Anomaloglossus baeobatrachus]|uniref:DNA damage-inducible transcript 3 protein n=1 Tax=Anomaloglossus baeobatrachus TaxID=238106 RepID=UPI003F4F4817